MASWPAYWMVITSIRPDVELYNVKINPFFTLHPTLDHFFYLFELTMFPRWAWNTLFIATVSTGISLFCGLLAGYALARLQFRWAPSLGTVIFITYLVPPTLLFIPLGDVVKTFGIGDTPWAVILTYPTFLIPFCTWLLMGYFKTIPRDLDHGPHQLPARRSGDPLRGDLRLHSLLERVSLRARFSLVTPTEDDSDRGLHRARAGRRLLLGVAHGRRPPGLDSRRPRLLVLRRALRHGSYWRRQRVATARPPRRGDSGGRRFDSCQAHPKISRLQIDGVDTAWCPLPCREDQRLVRVTRGGTVSLRRPAASALTSSTRPHRPWRPVHPARTSRRTRRPRQQLFRPPGSGCRPRAGWRRSVSTAGGWGHPGRRGPGTPWWDGGRGPPSTPYPWPLGCCPAACRPCARA